MEELQAGDPQVVGPYQLIGRLGSGGMGRVFLGQSPGGRLVAVKVIRPELAADPDFRTRFAREVEAARNVSGLFTAQVADADPDATMPWLATAYVAGPSLAEAITRSGPLPVSSVIALAAGLTEGLQAVHAAGLVHRDLKPTNVLLAHDGPRVIDFGISRASEASALTGTGLVVGSPGFMSPEQAEGGEIGTSSDIFSLGAVVAFAATGEGPFGGGSVASLLYRVVHSPASIDGVPDQIRPLVARCLDKDPGRRPTAGEILAELGPPSAGAHWLPAAIAQGYAYPARPDTEIAAGATGAAAVAGLAGAGRLAGVAGADQTVTGAAAYRAGPPGPGAADLQTINPGQPSLRRSRWRLAWPATAIAALLLAGAATVLALSSGWSPLTQSNRPAPLSLPLTPSTSPGSSTQAQPGSGKTSGATPAASASTLRQSPQASRSAQTRLSRQARQASQVPQISQTGTYQQGQLVYASVDYSDPGHDAQGFGFVGVNGSGWAQESHPFSSPSYGRVSPGRVDYPFNLACGTSQQYQSDVEFWIYDTAGARSKAVVIHLACTN